MNYNKLTLQFILVVIFLTVLTIILRKFTNWFFKIDGSITNKSAIVSKILIKIGLIILLILSSNQIIEIHDFYFLLKFIVFGCSIYFGIYCILDKEIGFSIIFFIIAVLYNPVIVITGIYDYGYTINSLNEKKHQYELFTHRSLLDILVAFLLVFSLINEIQKSQFIRKKTAIIGLIFLFFTLEFSCNIGVLGCYFGPCDEELEVERIADSTHMADSLGKVQEENQRIADSTAKAQAEMTVVKIRD